MEHVGGFGAIGGIFPTVWDWEKFWMLTAMLSIMLAVLNLLPIPALDGGHVCFYVRNDFGQKTKRQVS
jgi:regulator of sigma E protease